MFDGYRFILASKSPRRYELLAGLDIEFKVETGPEAPEAFNGDIPQSQVPEYLAKHKSLAFHRPLEPDEVLITADTLVFCPEEKQGSGVLTDEILQKCQILGKPTDREDAVSILSLLSDNTHYVLTGVALRTSKAIRSFTAVTEVTFKELTPEEISYYIDNYAPYDKAGAYGVQEWIGHIGITAIKGSYYNVMGLPVQSLYEELCKLCGKK
ncbi:MAG: septum formation inhibitor Maf [Bacteroidales bacterium]|nr:septum formation inhibitor Maf [Bacteroidales bacterium]